MRNASNAVAGSIGRQLALVAAELTGLIPLSFAP
jgi:hypothetical protein